MNYGVIWSIVGALIESVATLLLNQPLLCVIEKLILEEKSLK